MQREINEIVCVVRVVSCGAAPSQITKPEILHVLKSLGRLSCSAHNVNPHATEIWQLSSLFGLLQDPCDL